MMEFARQEMWPRLQQIWRRSFGDNEDYTHFLFQNLLRPENILIHTGNRKTEALEEHGKEEPLAMLCIETFQLCGNHRQEKAAYIYGVATDPSARGLGLSSELLKYLHGVLHQKGYVASVLVPASESLFNFYAKRSYKTEFDQKIVKIDGEDLYPAALPCVLTPGSLYRLDDLRSRILGNGRQLFVAWERDYLHYIGEECRLLGGEVLQISGTGREGYAVCYPVGETILIKELAVRLDRFDDVMAAIHARYGAREYQIRLPSDFSTSFPATSLPFGMIRWYDKEKGERFLSAMGGAPYIAHVLD